MTIQAHIHRKSIFKIIVCLIQIYSGLIASTVVAVNDVSAASNFEPATLLIKFKSNSKSNPSALHNNYPYVTLAPMFPKVSNSNQLALWYRGEVHANVDLETLKKQIEVHDQVDLVSLNSQFEITAQALDPTLESAVSIGQNLLYTDNQTNNSQSIKSSVLNGHAKLIVAVLDTGVDYTHEDLRNVMWINQAEKNGQDFVDDDNNGCVDDIYGCDMRNNVQKKLGYYPGLGGAYYNSEKYIYPDGMGHGTLVAGIIGAQQNNGVGIDGVSGNVEIMSVKFINQSNIANLADAALAIQYAVDNGAKIINNSYGKPNVDPENLLLLEDAFEYANQHGVLMIVSAGNYGVNIDQHQNFFPANFTADNMVTVCALDDNGMLWPASNYGPLSVDVGAPGVAIYSTAPMGMTSLFRKYYSNNGYLQTEGTSIAAPYVAGIAANIWSLYPSISHLVLKQALLAGAESIPALHQTTVTGGKINSQNAINWLESCTNCDR